MNIQVESYGHAVILNLKGEVTEDVLGSLGEAVEHQLEAPEVVDVVFHLGGVPFVDSAALEYLLELRDRLSERFGQVKLVKVDDNVMTILEVTRLRSSFEIYRDVSEAVKVTQA